MQEVKTMENKTVLEAVKKALSGKKRKFAQSVDVIIPLKRVDLKKNPVKINNNVVLPKGSGKVAKVVAVVDGEASTKAKGVADVVLTGRMLDDYKDKKMAKKLIESTDFFTVEAPLMQRFAQVFGRHAGSRGKMPLPTDVIAPSSDPTKIIERLKKSIRVRMRGQPVVLARVGTEEMSPEDITENIQFVYKMVVAKLPLDNIAAPYVKTTMGEAVKVQ